MFSFGHPHYFLKSTPSFIVQGSPPTLLSLLTVLSLGVCRFGSVFWRRNWELRPPGVRRSEMAFLPPFVVANEEKRKISRELMRDTTRSRRIV